VFTLVRWHMFSYQPKMTDAAIRRFIKNVGKENISDMMALRVGDRIGGGSKATSWRLTELQKRIGEQLYEPLSLKDLVVDGADVMRILAINPSKQVGKILESLFEEVIEDSSLNNKEYLEKRIKELGPSLV
jgi:tRNA nucleotidyltransferase (CCA-adding enzyme)